MAKANITVPIQVNLPDDWIEQIVNRLRDDPESEWVEIIRCKDCKWYEADIMANPWGVCCHDGWVDRQYSIGFAVDEDGFCYRAELKEAE